MPSGPPELHEYWVKYGPSDCGDFNAVRFLQLRGYTLRRDWHWIAPTPYHFMDAEEHDAVMYLILEWDYGHVAVW